MIISWMNVQVWGMWLDVTLAHLLHYCNPVHTTFYFYSSAVDTQLLNNIDFKAVVSSYFEDKRS